MSDNATPYAGLSPDVVLDAIAAAGFVPDGRLLALGSYENRVYQVGLEDEAPLVVKFYRPQRWSDAAIARGACVRARARRCGAADRGADR